MKIRNLIPLIPFILLSCGAPYSYISTTDSAEPAYSSTPHASSTFNQSSSPAYTSPNTPQYTYSPIPYPSPSNPQYTYTPTPYYTSSSSTNSPYPYVTPYIAEPSPSAVVVSSTPLPIQEFIDTFYVGINSPQIVDFNFAKKIKFLFPQGANRFFIVVKIMEGNINNITAPNFNTFSVKSIVNSYPQIAIKKIELNNQDSVILSASEKTKISIEVRTQDSFSLDKLATITQSCVNSDYSYNGTDLTYNADSPKDYNYNSPNNPIYRINDTPSFEYKYTNTSSNSIVRIDNISFINSQKATNEAPNLSYIQDIRLETFTLDGNTINNPNVSSLNYYERFICPKSFTLINLPFKIPNGIGKIHREDWKINASVINSNGDVKPATITNQGAIWKIIYVSDGVPSTNTNTDSSNTITVDSLGTSLLHENYKSITQRYLEYNGDTPTDTCVTGYHPGIDYEAPSNTLVYSPMSGEVVRGANESSFNSIGRITIKTSNNKYFSFLHLSSSRLNTGSLINAGDIIGSSGSTGASKPHLHVELTTDGSINCYFPSNQDTKNALNPTLYNQN